jgi:hypothetical protein
MYLTICILFTFLQAFSNNRWIFFYLFFIIIEVKRRPGSARQVISPKSQIS